MADFKQAIEWMKEGKNVNRYCWKALSGRSFAFLKMLKNGSTNNIYWIYGDDSKSIFKPNITDFEATDWEIYEEEYNWNLEEEFIKTEFDMDNVIDIHITLKQKILDDINELQTWNSASSENYEWFNTIPKDKVIEILEKRFGF